MGQDKHQPKDAKKKFSISSDAEKVLVGIMISLISLIGFLNRGFVGEFLTYIMVYVFGVFYFIFFLFFIFFGLFYAVKKKAINIKINLYLLGGILLLLSLMIGASLSIENLTLRNIFSTYNNRVSYVSDSLFSISNLSQLGLTGGGFIGTFFAALFNTAFTSLGTYIIVIFLLVVSAIILLKSPIKSFFQYIKTKRSEKNEKSETAEDSGSGEENIKVPGAEEEKPTVPEIVPSESTAENKVSPFKTFEPKKNTEFSQTVLPVDPPNGDIDDKPLVDTAEIRIHDVAAEEEESDNKFSFFRHGNLSKSAEPPVVDGDSVADDDINRPEDPSSTSDLETPRSRQTEIKFTSIREENNEFMMPGVKTSASPAVEAPKRKYILPGVDMLSLRQDDSKNEVNQQESRIRADEINRLFDDFKIHASVISFNIGPSVTRFNVRTEPGVRVNSISGLTDDLQVALKGDKSVRIETVVQGRDTSGIEVGNKAPTTVNFRDCFAAVNNSDADKLVIPLGQDISKEVITISIDDLPHLLIAGTTGSGKSVFVHSLVMTLIMRNYPDELRLILIDPKKVEFTKYNNIPHLYCPIITDPVQATAALFKLVNEMERRFSIMAREEVVNIKEYRNLVKDNPNKEVIPNIVVVIDEFADLMSQNAKEIEPLIQRLAQKARASGIYLIIATQRPSVNVITGDIKANIPARIALSVSSFIDSKTILDESGAETLIGKGDLLARIPTRKSLIRVQSAYVDNDEITRVTSYLKEQQKPCFNQEFLNLKTAKDEQAGFDGSGNFNANELHDRNRSDPLYPTIRDYVVGSGNASTSSIMRNFRLGYGKAASFLDTLEDDGYIKTIAGGRKQVIKKDMD